MHELSWNNLNFILASASPRRRELLYKVGLIPEIFPVGIDETPQAGTPSEQVEDLARRKAFAAANKHPGISNTGSGRPVLILASDTLVFYLNKPLGKAQDRSEAIRFLKMLSDHEHSVYTGIALQLLSADTCKMIVDHARTKVHFHKLSQQKIESYLDTGEYTDKAGAYAIQGGAAEFVKSIEGEYENVVGLPLLLLKKMLSQLGLSIPATSEI